MFQIIEMIYIIYMLFSLLGTKENVSIHQNYFLQFYFVCSLQINTGKNLSFSWVDEFVSEFSFGMHCFSYSEI